MGSWLPPPPLRAVTLPTVSIAIVEACPAIDDRWPLIERSTVAVSGTGDW